VYVTYLLKSDDASFNDLLSDVGQKVEIGGRPVPDGNVSIPNIEGSRG